MFTRHPNQTKEASALKSGLEPCAIPPAKGELVPAQVAQGRPVA